MKEYFLLQFKMLNRKVIEYGFPLLLGYTLIPILFVLLSEYLFSKTEYAVYFYGLFMLFYTSKLSESQRNDFLKSIYNKRDYLKLRIVENIICSVPFILFLVYKQLYLAALILCIINTIIGLVPLNMSFNYTIPTPFSKRPFEFVVGFRNTFFIFPIAYLLNYIAIREGNFNLGVFSIFIIAFVCFYFYSKIENEYYVWNFNLNPHEFLKEKIKTCLLYFTILCIPIVLPLSFFFFNEIDILFIKLLLSSYNHIS